MSRRNKMKNKVLEGIRMTDYAAEGKCVARRADGEKVIFVPLAAVGDVVDVVVTRSRSSYIEGRIGRIVTPSPDRVEPFCRHFGTCGGCKWQHVPYAVQLQFKQKQVMDALGRIGKVALPECRPIAGSELQTRYRNKLEYTFSARRWMTWDEMRDAEAVSPLRVAADSTDGDGTTATATDAGGGNSRHTYSTTPQGRPALGFHIPDCFDKVLDIDECHLGDAISDRIRLEVRRFAIDNSLTFYDLRNNVGLLRNLVVRTATTGQVMVIVVFAADEPDAIRLVMDHLRATFPEITSLVYVVNAKQNDAWADQTVHLWSGADHIYEQMEGLRFKVGPKSFYQTNSRQAYTLYKHVRELAGLTGRELVYDLYTGTGTIANFVARQARRVVGIEYVEPAIADARINSAENGIENTEFHAGDMKDILTHDFIEAHGRPDVIITDPPRAGMHPDVVEAILFAAPRVIVYVSCNPATQARDLAMLDAAYRVTDIQPVDMFPHTQHVENIVRLERRESPAAQ